VPSYKTKTMKKLLYLLLPLLLLTSCRSTKPLTGELTGKNAEYARYEQLCRSSFKYEALQSKVKYALGRTSLGGKLCVESGKRVCMQINAPIIGFEVARVEASAQEVILVDKYDKIYSKVNPSEVLFDIQELQGHEMEALESLMLGRIFVPGKGQATTKDYTRFDWQTPTNADGTQGNSVATYKGKDYTITYQLDANGRLVSTHLEVGGTKHAWWEYADYREVETGKWVPTSERIKLDGGEDQKIELGLTLTNPQLGESTWRDFDPAASFRQVPFSELVEAIKAVAK